MPTPAVASAIIQKGDSVLLLKRGPTAPWMPNKWNFPMGHIEAGETPQAAAKRETHEEAGIVALGLQHVLTLELPTNTVAYFHTTTFKGTPKIDYESSAWRWVAVSEVKTYDCIPGVNRALKALWKDTMDIKQIAAELVRLAGLLIESGEGFAPPKGVRRVAGPQYKYLRELVKPGCPNDADFRDYLDGIGAIDVDIPADVAWWEAVHRLLEQARTQKDRVDVIHKYFTMKA